MTDDIGYNIYGMACSEDGLRRSGRTTTATTSPGSAEAVPKYNGFKETSVKEREGSAVSYVSVYSTHSANEARYRRYETVHDGDAETSMYALRHAYRASAWWEF